MPAWQRLESWERGMLVIAYNAQICKPCFGEGYTKSGNVWRGLGEKKHACQVCFGKGWRNPQEERSSYKAWV